MKNGGMGILRGRSLQRALVVSAAAMLLGSTFAPIVEIKGFSTFTLPEVALWATRVVRVTLALAIVSGCLLPVGASRWWLALSVGLMFGPLVDIAARSGDLCEMLRQQAQMRLGEIVVIRLGAVWLGLGLIAWFSELPLAIIHRPRGHSTREP